MPLMGKKPFVRDVPPSDLHPMEELFFCKITQEAFRDYDRLFDRVILCNSLVWTCSITGKPGLTYAEAIESEQNALLVMKKFPEALKRPLLYLASLTKRGRINEMCDDVFAYAKDRFFVGETVDVSLNGIKKTCEVTAVICPDTPQSRSPKAKQVRNVNPDKIKYEIVEKELDKKVVVKNQCISRQKGTLTKPHNKLFLKHHSSPQQGIWTVKDDAVDRYDLTNFEFNDVFTGPLPKYAITPVKKKVPERLSRTPVKGKASENSGKKTAQSKLNFKKESVDEKRKNQEREQLEFEKRRLRMEMEKENRKKRLEEQRSKQKEEKRKLTEYMNIWKRPRDDLECDDQKDLPKPCPIDCSIPQSQFGDAVMILEFLNAFGSFLKLKDFFPQGFAFEHLEKVLFDTNIQGYLCDLIQLLMASIFQHNHREKKMRSRINVKNISRFIQDGAPRMSPDDAEFVADAVSVWPLFYHGAELMNLPLDAFSLTEILRLHILSSGTTRDRGYTHGFNECSEDPGLYFKINETDILLKLATTSVFQLKCEERIKVLTLLVNQLLSSLQFRNSVNENLSKIRPLKGKLKQLSHSRNKILLNLKKPKENKPVEGAEAVNDGKSEVVDNSEEPKEIDEKEKRAAEKQLADLHRRVQVLREQVKNIRDYNQLAPLGLDRAFRRYWVFPTLPGIFVEDDDKFVGPCLLKETPQIPCSAVMNRAENTSGSIGGYLQHAVDPKNGSSDKENDILQDLAIIQSDFYIPPKDRKLTDLNTRVDVRKENNCLLCKDKMEEMQSNVTWICPHTKTVPQVFGLCTASIDTCPVHNFNELRTQWAFFYNPEELDTLIASLNPRGFREGKLKDALVKELKKYKGVLEKCPSHYLNKSLPIPAFFELRKSQRRQGATTGNNNHHHAFAGMGPENALEVVLRDTILELEHNIFVGYLGSINVKSRERWREALESNSYDSQCDDLELESVMDIKIELMENDTVKELACALLQISRGIEQRCLNPPLGKVEKKGDYELQHQTRDSEEFSSQKMTHLQKWQKSLLECTSLSQLFVHLGTLERSVAWSRSTTKAYCRICKRRGDAENMLLCDECNRGHHLYCLKPPLTSVPEGDWFCITCRPIEKITPKDTPESSQYMESSGEESENSDSESSESAADEEYNSEVVIEVCKACQVGGIVICCDGCPDVYHQECVGLRRIPRGDWFCPNCTKKESKKDEISETKSSKTTSESTTLQTRIPSRSTRRLQQEDVESSDTDTSDLKPTRSGTKRKLSTDSDSSYTDPEPEKPKKRRSERKSNNHETKSEPEYSRSTRDSASKYVVRRSSKIASSGDLLDYKTCLDIVNELMHHSSSWPFLVPVSKKDAPDYHLVIRCPMDLGSIRSKLHNMKYATNREFIRDLHLVSENCEMYNPKFSPEYKAGRTLLKEIMRLLEAHGLGNTNDTNAP